jgi:hypothetical protein
VPEENFEMIDNAQFRDENNEIGEINFETKNIGIYFPEFYIETLLEVKSHMVASHEFYTLANNDCNIAIIILENEIMYVYSFHEGVTRKVLEYNNEEIIVENQHYEENKIYIINEYTIKTENDILYTNVNKEIENWYSEVTAYVTDIIFGNEIYTNTEKEEIFRMENGNISFKNIEYTIGLNTVFTNSEYDLLYSSGQNNIYFRKVNDVINIYELILSDDLLDDPMGQILGEYILLVVRI